MIVGGAASGILGEGFAILWALLVAFALIAECAAVDWAERHELNESDPAFWGLAGSAFLASAVMITLPIALWGRGPEASAAALAIFVLATTRHVRAEPSRLALAGLAPAALALVTVPLLHALRSPAADWNASVVAVASGAALAVYMGYARLCAERLEAHENAELKPPRLVAP